MSFQFPRLHELSVEPDGCVIFGLRHGFVKPGKYGWNAQRCGIKKNGLSCRQPVPVLVFYMSGNFLHTPNYHLFTEQE